MPTPRKIPAVIETIHQHADNVKSFIMRPEKAVPKFKPGQFLHLALETYDPSSHWPESRVFSIANSPTRCQTLRITFAVKGKFTSQMFYDVKEQDQVSLKLPYGNFTFLGENEPYVFVAGGTGITPFASYLEYAIDQKLPKAIDLWYGVRSVDHVIFGELLSECQAKLSRFHLHLFLENPAPHLPFPDVKTGILPIKIILEQSQKKGNPIYYISGPPLMIKDVRGLLMDSGLKDDRIRVDAWE